MDKAQTTIANDLNKTPEERFKALKELLGEGKVFQIEVPKSDNEKDGTLIGFVSRPDRNVLKAFASLSVADPLGALENVLNSTWIGGDSAILEDDDYFLSACTCMEDVVTIRQATLKKN